MIARHALPLALAAALVPAAAAAQFEGTVTATMTTPRTGATPVVQHFKGDRMRAELTLMGQSAWVLVDGRAGKGWTVLPAQRVYMTTDVADVPPRPREAAPRVRKIGRRETIAGIACEHWAFTHPAEPGDTMDVCIAKGLGVLRAPGARGRADVPDLRRWAELAGDDPAWKELMKDGAFPLSLVTTGRDGERMRMTVTKVERRALPDSLFAVPAGYTEMRMPTGAVPAPGR